jgi:predicted glycoside hydrolase/deacetylase ChbG (UPF0249 family)
VYLIVNADDFGMSDGVNGGIILAHEQGIVTSASLMVHGRGARDAADYARSNHRLGVGLHCDLGEWVLRGGEWEQVYHVVDTSDRSAVRAEVRRQLDGFRALMDRNPTHIDSHQHTHRREPVRSEMQEMADELGVPLREVDDRVRYCGAFYGLDADGTKLSRRLTPEGLRGIIASLEPGIVELGVHPGLDPDPDDVYGAEREDEVMLLCDPALRSFIDDRDIRLTSFGELPDIVGQLHL